MAGPTFDGWDEPTLAEITEGGLRPLFPPGRTILSHRAEPAHGRRILLGLLILAILIGLALGLFGLSGRAQPLGVTGRHEDGRASRGGLRPAIPSVPSPGDAWAPPSQSAANPATTPPAVPSPATSAPASLSLATAAATPAAMTAEPRAPRAAARPTVTSTAGPSPSPAPTPTPSPSGVRTITAYLTGYSSFDNTPSGPVATSHPVLHTSAGGTGSYADPITVAVGHLLVDGQDILDWPAGTRFYVPNLRRYFIVEDICGGGPAPQDGPCHTGYPSTATTWLDLWIGGSGGVASGADSCRSSITGVWDVLVDPAANYATAPGDVYDGGVCTSQFGNAVVMN